MAHHKKYEDDEDRGPSKSSLKRESHALQDLGKELVELGKSRLAKLPIDDDLRDAIKDYQRFTAHEARRRQLQYIGKLMRNVDPAPIREVLDGFKGQSSAATARMHRLEALRTRLLDDEKTLHEIAETYPGTDLQQLRTLRRNALKEKELAKPPRAFRELFQFLRDLDPGEIDAGLGDDDDGDVDEDAAGEERE